MNRNERDSLWIEVNIHKGGAASKEKNPQKEIAWKGGRKEDF
jgi:hypothetical protein